jgi:hypothetical protein
MHAALNLWASPPCILPTRRWLKAGCPSTACRAKLASDDGVDLKEKHKIFDEVFITVK